MWNEVNKNLIHVSEDGVISYGNEGKPFRFQIPCGQTDDGISEWSKISLKIDLEFYKWFSDIEEYIGKTEPFESIASCDRINIKFDEKSTQIFDINKQLMFDKIPSLANSKLYVILEIVKKYGPFKGREFNGLVCKAYQIVYKPMEVECLFT